jgi:hypothetical protein
MARKSIDQLVGQSEAALPDNTSGAISPADVRTMIRDFLDTVTPTYGGLQIVSRPQALNTTPANLIFQSAIASFPPEWAADPVAGTLVRVPGVPVLNARFTVNGDVIGAQGEEVTVALYANDVFTGWASTVTAQGPTNRGTFSFSAIQDIKEATTFALKVSSSKVVNFTFENVLFIGENIAVRSFAQTFSMQPAKVPQP